MVGAYRSNSGGISKTGQAYLFKNSGGSSSSQSAILNASDKAASAYFGTSVSVCNTTALVGANLADIGATSNAGQAYVFTISGSPTVTGITGQWDQYDQRIDYEPARHKFHGGGYGQAETRPGFRIFTGSSVTVVSPTQITCTFDLTNKIAGTYNVVVTNSYGQAGMLVNGFTVVVQCQQSRHHSVKPGLTQQWSASPTLPARISRRGLQSV